MPTFTDFFPTLPTVNLKFLITDFWLLSTSVKPKNFIDFYRSKKKNETPPVLTIYGTGSVHYDFNWGYTDIAIIMLR